MAFYFEKFYYRIEIIQKFYSFDRTVKLDEYEGIFSTESNTVDRFPLSPPKLLVSAPKIGKMISVYGFFCIPWGLSHDKKIISLEVFLMLDRMALTVFLYHL